MQPNKKIDFQKKQSVLDNLRVNSLGIIDSICKKYGEDDYKSRASAINRELIIYKNDLIKAAETESKIEKWPPETLLASVLLVTYCSYVVMLEARNEVWPYEYMAFARRIGELWEPFCLLCWDYPVNPNISYTQPPTFKDVKENLIKELGSFIDELSINTEQKDKLNNFYQLVWNLVVSGEIQLKSDLHFKDQTKDYVVDFKSGFSSNEKGNTNRLLMVASIYKAITGYDCLLFVRSKEELNNHYLQTLKNSGLWKVYCGDETYEQISKFTQFDLTSWVKLNINWEQDFSKKMYEHLKKNNLSQYLEW